MFNLNVIRGGVKENVVAGECHLTVNHRYLPNERYEEVVAKIETAVRHGLKNSRLLDLKMDFYNIFSPVEIDPETDASRKLRAAATAIWGYQDFRFGGISASLTVPNLP